jgi:hypothetical protein
MKVLTSNTSTHIPPFIQRLEHILPQCPFLKVLQILHKLLITTRPDDHLVTKLIPKLRMMHHPPQGNLTLPRLTLRIPQGLKGREERIIPKPRTVHFPLHAIRIEARSRLEGRVARIAMVAVRDPAACERIEGVERHVVVA